MTSCAYDRSFLGGGAPSSLRNISSGCSLRNISSGCSRFCPRFPTSSSSLRNISSGCSLRSLLLFAVFVAILCSIGVCTNWSVSAVIAVGGITGGIVARSWLGFALGVLSGGICAVMMAAVCLIMWRLLFRVPFSLWIASPLDGVNDGIRLAAIVGSLLGGVFGGRVARVRSER